MIPNRTKYLEHFMAIFGLTYSPSSSDKLNCSSEVTLTYEYARYKKLKNISDLIDDRQNLMVVEEVSIVEGQIWLVLQIISTHA